MSLPTPDLLRKARIKYAEALREKEVREARRAQSNPCGGLLEFIRYFWHVLEPVDPFVEGWPLQCLSAHLEAITRGDTIEVQDGVERPFNRLLANVPPGFMKAIDCETQVLTTWGWKRHGDLRPGDFVFGADGQSKRVLGNTEPGLEESYEVEFDDGSVVVAGKGHLWQVERDFPYGAPGARRCRKPQVVTTTELIKSTAGRALQRPDRISLAESLNSAPKRLLIDPYVLGAWLGDGATSSGVIYSGDQDVEHFKQLGRVAHTTPAAFGDDGRQTRQPFHRINIEDLQVKLRVMGLLGNKHIPDDYLEASIEQREQLLRGLMDTDGSANKDGHCSITSKLEHLAKQIAQLVASLNLKPHLNVNYSVLNGRRHGPYYTVNFTAPQGARLFSLARKQERLRGHMNVRSRARYVQDVRPIGPKLVNCITVEDQLYVVTDRFITTHNSLTVNTFWPAWEWGPMELPHLRYVAFSYASDLTERDNAKFRDLVCSREYRELWGHVFNVVGDGKIRVTNDKTGFKFASSLLGVGTGERGHRVLCFAGDQKVLTEHGSISIKKIVDERIACRAWSFNQTTRHPELRRITGWHRTPGRPLLRITTESGTSVTCTWDHKLYSNQGLLAADLLSIGDALCAAPSGMRISGRHPLLQGSFRHNKAQSPPLPSCPYTIDGGMRGIEVLRNPLKRCRAAVLADASGNLPYQLFRKVRRAIAPSTMALAIFDVLRPSSVFKVAEAAIRSIAVQVANFLVGRPRAYKGLHQEDMYGAIVGAPVFAKAHARISIDQRCYERFAFEHHNVIDPIMRRAVGIGSVRPGSGNGAGQATNLPETRDAVSILKPHNWAPAFERIISIERLHAVPPWVYCVTVEENHNLFCGDAASILAANCDDLNKIKGSAESDESRLSVATWALEAMQNRLNDLQRDAIVCIQQRTHERDVSGALSQDLGNEYCHLIVPMEYEDGRHFSHYKGWNDGNDPRERDGELAWPERFPLSVLTSYRANTYLWAGQYQQRPAPRGGGLIKEEWWQIHEVTPKFAVQSVGGTQRNVITGYKFTPEFTPLFVIASLDTAFSEKEENDYSALTVWAVHNHPQTKHRAILLVDAWQKRLPHLHGETVERLPDESPGAYRRRAKEKWGLVEWVAETCKLRRVDRLVIENKNRGPDVVKEIKRLYSDQDWSVQALDVRGDKWSRGHAIVDLFTDGMIFAPAEIKENGTVWYLEWAKTAIEEISGFPRSAHDDLFDSMTLALQNLRTTGWAIRKDEKRASDIARSTFKGNKREPIYQV